METKQKLDEDTKNKSAEDYSNKGYRTFQPKFFNLKLQPQTSKHQTLNTSYLTNSYIVFTLKMESVSRITIFGLKIMVKSGLIKIFLHMVENRKYFFLPYVLDLIHVIMQKCC